MKRYLSLLLIALMMITVLFVSVACKEEPAPEPEPEVVVTKYTVSFVTNGGTPKLDPESIAEGSTITKTKKQPKYPLTDESIAKIWCMYTMQYY